MKTEADFAVGEARIAGPPILIGQGERTQGEWLYKFLLNPDPIRKETVLRMPRFNMSPQEAKALVSYFAGVERIKSHVRSTFTPGVLSDVGSFGGLFALDWKRYSEPVLVSSIDGVGTKLKVAIEAIAVNVKR